MHAADADMHAANGHSGSTREIDDACSCFAVSEIHMCEGDGDM